MTEPSRPTSAPRPKPSPDRSAHFLQDRIALFAHMPTRILLGHMASISVLIYLVRGSMPLGYLALFAVVEVVCTPAAMILLNTRAQPDRLGQINQRRWVRTLSVLCGFVGLNWGIFLFLSMDAAVPVSFALQIATAAGANAAASRSLHMFAWPYRLYGTAMLVPIAVRLVTLGDDHILLGLLVLVYLVMMLAFARDAYKQIIHFVGIKFENLELAQKFEQAARSAEQANKAKSQFLAQANHDLRQPIHAIGLLTSVLRDQKLDNQGIHILDTIDQSLDNLTSLFKSLLSISALDSGALRPEKVRFPVGQAIEQIVSQALPEARERGCVIHVVATSLWVETDKALFASIVQNVVFNAIKYAPGSKILIGVRRVGGRASVQVLDQGPGVAPKHQQEIFQEFTRLAPIGQRRVEGLGLGLSIVARTAKLLDLRVDFQSREGRGTHVAIAGLPIVETGGSPAQNDPQSVKSGSPSKGTILLIDDNRAVLASTQTLLEKWGYTVLADVSRDVLYDIRLEDIDLLLIDYHLNFDVTGIDFAQDLRRQRPDGLPTIIISGTLNDTIAQQAAASGFLVLHKPTRPAQLRSALLSLGL